MTFAWPYALLLLLVAPLLLAIYLLVRRRRRRFAVQYASLALIREALPAQSRWRRRLPFALFLLALVSLAIAAARPQVVVAVPTNRTSIILAIDVSLSMCSTDVQPNRLSAAQQVARDFVKNEPNGTRIGIVEFSGIAQLVVPPTTNRSALIAAIDGFTAGRGTAVGTAILRAVDAIAEIDPNVTRTGVAVNGPGSAVPGGGYVPDIVVLLTDGATTQGVSPAVAAQQAADRRVRVYTIGFGTAQGGPIVCAPSQLDGNVFGGFRFGGQGFGSRDFGRNFGGGGGGGLRSALLLDEQTLQEIAATTGATYHRAQDANQLAAVFKGLPAEITRQQERVEFSVVFAAVGGLLAAAAVGLSFAWNRYG